MEQCLFFDRFFVTFGFQLGIKSEAQSLQISEAFSEKDPCAARVATHGSFVVFGGILLGCFVLFWGRILEVFFVAHARYAVDFPLGFRSLGVEFCLLLLYILCVCWAVCT